MVKHESEEGPMFEVCSHWSLNDQYPMLKHVSMPVASSNGTALILVDVEGEQQFKF